MIRKKIFAPAYSQARFLRMKRLGWIVLTAACVATSRSDDWPQWRGPQHNGVSRETAWAFQWPDDGPKIAWKSKVGLGYSGFASILGVAFAPSPSPLFVVKDAGGTPRGVTVDLAEALAKELAVPLELFVAPNTGELVDALEAGRIDVSFMPVDEERKKRIAFGPVYFEVESTYMVTAASGIAIGEARR